MSSKMFFVQIAPLLLLINLAFSYRLERQSDLEPLLEPTNATASSVLKEEISGLDNDDNYQPWREWPDRLFPRFHTSSDTVRPTWTIITRSKTVLPSDLSLSSSDLYSPVASSDSPFTSIHPSSPQLTPVHSPTSDVHLSPSPTIASDYVGETSSIYLPPNSSADILTRSSYPIQSSFSTDDLQTPSTSAHSTPSITDSFFDSSPFIVPFSPSVPQSTPSVPSIVSSNQLSGSDQFESISSTLQSASFIPHPTPTIDWPPTTAHYDSTTENSHPPTTTPSPDSREHIHRTVLELKLPEGMNKTELQDKFLKKVFDLALSKENRSSTATVQLKHSEAHNGTLILEYSVQVDGKYLDSKRIEELWNLLTDQERKNILYGTEPGPKELLARKLFDLESPYFWITVGLLLILMLLCCFYLGMAVCWCTNRSKMAKFGQSAFIKKDLNQLSPGSEYSSDTLNTENFIRWRSRPDSKQQLNKRAKSLFKDDHKSGSLGKLRRKEMGSSPSNEFEYISFSSDTTNSSLQRDGSIKKLNSTVRHHPYSSQEHQRTHKRDHRDFDYQRDYQQDYTDYQGQVIEKSNQLNQPNSIKLLISRGVQNNLLTDDYRYRHSSTKKYPLEIPQSFHGYYNNNNVSVLNLSKEKLIPLNQYTSDSSTTTTTTNTINDKYDKQDSSFDKPDGTFSKRPLSASSKPDGGRLSSGRLDSRSSRPQSRSDSRGSPKRLVKKEIIEEFETITTTTTFKNSNRNSPNLSGSPEVAVKDAQLNEQTKSIINAIRDELKKFNTTGQHQSIHVQQLKKT